MCEVLFVVNSSGDLNMQASARESRRACLAPERLVQLQRLCKAGVIRRNKALSGLTHRVKHLMLGLNALTERDAQSGSQSRGDHNQIFERCQAQEMHIRELNRRLASAQSLADISKLSSQIMTGVGAPCKSKSKNTTPASKSVCASLLHSLTWYMHCTQELSTRVGSFQQYHDEVRVMVHGNPGGRPDLRFSSEQWC